MIIGVGNHRQSMLMYGAATEILPIIRMAEYHQYRRPSLAASPHLLPDLHWDRSYGAVAEGNS